MADLTEVTDEELWNSSIHRVISLRDPVHDYVELPYAIGPIISHPFMQRLKNISQTSMSLAVFPSMNGQRFEHSIGAAHLAVEGWTSAWKNTTPLVRRLFRDDVVRSLESVAEEREEAVTTQLAAAREDLESFFDMIEIGLAAAALIHDIGHPPFSHTLESFYGSHINVVVRNMASPFREHTITEMSSEAPIHEQAGKLISARLKNDLADIKNIPWSLVEMILIPSGNRGSWSQCLHDVISGDIDVDRMDYLLRDAHNSGTEFGLFDLRRLIQSLELHALRSQMAIFGKSNDNDADWAIGFGLRAVSAVESMIVARFQYYRWVVFHNRVVAMNRFLAICLDYLVMIECRGAAPYQTVPELNYFATASTGGLSRSRSMSSVDDGTITEWMKSARERYMHDRISADSLKSGDPENIADYEIARVRFVALADIVLFQGSNWTTVWKSQWAYRQICQELFDRLKERVNSAAEQFEQFAAAQKVGDANDSPYVLHRRKSLQKLLLAQSPSGSGGPPAGAVPFMNAIAQLLLREGSPTPNSELRHEVDEADYFGTFINNRDGMEYGFWVFAYDGFEPLEPDGFDRWTSHVFANNERRSIIDIGDSSIINLTRRESERSHFNCYFVHPEIDRDMTVDEADRVRRWFKSNFPLYVYDTLLHFLLPSQ